MGDRTYTRFSIPLSAIGTKKRRRVLAAALGMTIDEVVAVCEQDPATNESVAGYANDTALRLVDGIPCLVFEDDECNYGGSSIEEDLRKERIPFLRFHLGGGDYGPGRAAFTGSGEMHWIDCDGDAKPVIRVTVVDGKAVVDPNALVHVNELLAAERVVLHRA